MARTLAAGSPERQNRFILIGFLALAGLAAVLVFLALSEFGSDDEGGGSSSFAGTVNVVTVSQDVPAGTRLSGDVLTLTTLPENGIVDGALTSTDDLDGLVVRQDLARGEQLTAVKVGLELPDDEKFLSAVIPPGMRAGSVTVDENTMVGGLVVAGDRVDVIILVGSYDDPEDPISAITLLQDVEVLAVAQESQRPITRLDRDGNPIETDTASGSLAARPEDTEANEDARTVTLAVTPEDAPLLALTQASDANLTVYLSLRPEGDREILPIGPVGLPE